MASSFKLLAEGQLANSKGDLFACGASEEAVVSKVVITNTTGSDGTFGLYVKASGGTSRRISPSATPLKANGTTHIHGPFTLGNSETLEGDGSVATSFDYSVHGDLIT